MESYRAIALQTKCFAVNRAKSKPEAEEIIKQAIARISNQILGAVAFVGPDTKLIVLPEYFLTGFPMGESIGEWREKACLEIDGEIYDLLGKLAQDRGIHLAGNAYELDPHFPGLYFQTSFIIAPNGDVVLRYRRLNSMFAPTPHDVWDEYLDVYGLEGVFPVARTEIGNLACIASEEILYPEVARCLAMRGAEVFCHSSSEVFGMENTPKNVAKLARAYENMAYVVSANSGGLADIPIPENSTDGGSKIVDYKGLVIAETAQGESINAFAEIDLAALRRNRRRAGMGNILSRQRFELYAESYAKNSFYPPNTLIGSKADRSHFIETQKRVIAKLADDDVI
ncbi:MAG: nitrilase [Acidobacteria bacterium]|nr:nitrilase [Acidobacteriota bacterium]MBK8148604.1 nitrilase [Acidobacteriota bacterium]